MATAANHTMATSSGMTGEPATGNGRSREEKEKGGGPALTSVAGKARGRVEVAGDGVGVRRPEADGG